MRTIYKGKHDILLKGLKRMEPYFETGGEFAGLHVLLTDRQKRPEERLVRQAEMAGVGVYGLSEYFIARKPGQVSSTVLLGYANLSEEQIVGGLDRLYGVWCNDKEQKV